MDTCITVQYDTIWHVFPAGTAFVNNDSTGLVVLVVFPDTLPIPPGGFIEFTVSAEIVAVAVDTLPCWNNCLGECASILADTVACGILPWKIKVCAPDSYLDVQSVCPGQCVDFMGQTYCAPGVYTVTEADVCGCVDAYTLQLFWNFYPPTTVSAASHTCSADGSEYDVSFDVVPAQNFVTINGQPFSGGVFTDGPIPAGQSYSYTVESTDPCGIVEVFTVAVTHDCPPCQGDTINLGQIQLCPGECFAQFGNTYCSPGTYEELLYNSNIDCYETCQFVIVSVLEDPLTVGIATEICDATNLYYTVGFSILSGVAPFSVNGNPISGNFYQSGLIPSRPVILIYRNGCSNLQPSSSGSQRYFYLCLHQRSPGTMAFTTINQCEGEMADAAIQ